MNEHVLTMPTSASSRAPETKQPRCAVRASMTSESIRLRAHPVCTSETVVGSLTRRLFRARAPSSALRRVRSVGQPLFAGEEYIPRAAAHVRTDQAGLLQLVQDATGLIEVDREAALEHRHCDALLLEDHAARLVDEPRPALALLVAREHGLRTQCRCGRG